METYIINTGPFKLVLMLRLHRGKEDRGRARRRPHGIIVSNIRDLPLRHIGFEEIWALMWVSSLVRMSRTLVWAADSQYVKENGEFYFRSVS